MSAPAACSRSPRSCRCRSSFLFDGGPSGLASSENFGEGSSPAYISDFLATSEGLALTRAFTRIADSKLRRSIVELVEQIALREAADKP